MSEKDKLREYVYATYYGFMIREVQTKGGSELLSTERELCEQLTDKIMNLVESYTARQVTEAHIDELNRYEALDHTGTLERIKRVVNHIERRKVELQNGTSENMPS
jgi:hypothetical protein